MKKASFVSVQKKSTAQSNVVPKTNVGMGMAARNTPGNRQ